MGSPEHEEKQGFSEAYEFGGFVLTPAEASLTRAGEPVEIQQKALTLLSYLVRHHDRNVSKEELQQAVWPKVIVSEAALTRAVMKARKALADGGDRQSWIKTVHGHGYRFTGAVRRVAAETGPAVAAAAAADDAGGGDRSPAAPARGRSRRWLAAVCAGLLVLVLLVVGDRLRPLPGIPSAPAGFALVVLPFAGPGADPGDAPLAAGMTETLRSELSTQAGVRVLAEASSARLEAAPEGADAVARRLGVRYLVEGRVQAEGDRLRINVALVSGHTGQRLWSQRFDGVRSDLFGLQDRSAGALLTALRSEEPGLDGAADGLGHRIRGTDNLAAYELWLAGAAEQRARTKTSLQAALPLFEQSLELAPDYARAWSDLALTRVTLATWGVGNRAEGMAAARRDAQRAIGLDDQLMRPYLVLMEIAARYEWRFDTARRYLAAAVALAPNDPDLAATQATLLSKLGQHEAALDPVERAWRLDPLNPAVAATRVTRLIRAGRVNAARAALAQLLELSPDYGDRHWHRALLALRAGDPATAYSAIQADELAHLRLSISAIAAQQQGLEAQARAALDELVRTDADGAAFQIAEVYAQWGEAAESLRWLERAYERRDPGMGELLSSNMLEPLYAEPGFLELLDRMTLPRPPLPETAALGP